MSVKFQKPRGTIDILPKDIPVWHKIENTARQICKKFGFDSLGYQSLDGVLEAIGIDRDKVCTYCWNGKE